jgi:hypothetical protein
MGYLQDDQGHKSAMRVMCMGSLMAAIALALLSAFGHGSNDTMTLVYGFLVAAFGGKVGQKYIEPSPEIARSP